MEKENITNNIKLEQEEINRLTSIQQKNQRVVQQFGQIAISERMLEEQKKSVEQDLFIVQREEKELVQEFETKYGKGSIDLSTGEFIPA